MQPLIKHLTGHDGDEDSQARKDLLLRCFCVPARGQVDLAATSLVIAAVGAPARAALTPMGNSQGQLYLQDVDSVRFEYL